MGSDTNIPFAEDILLWFLLVEPNRSCTVRERRRQKMVSHSNASALPPFSRGVSVPRKSSDAADRSHLGIFADAHNFSSNFGTWATIKQMVVVIAIKTIAIINGVNVYRYNNRFAVYVGDSCVPVAIDNTVPSVMKNVATMSKFVSFSPKILGAKS